MPIEILTKEDLQLFRMQLLEDIKVLLSDKTSTKKWLRSSEVRKILQISSGTLQNLRINNTLHPVKISGTWYYSISEIDKLFEERTDKK